MVDAYTLYFIGSPCNNVSYYNYNFTWSHYIVLHLVLQYPIPVFIHDLSHEIPKPLPELQVAFYKTFPDQWLYWHTWGYFKLRGDPFGIYGEGLIKWP